MMHEYAEYAPYGIAVAASFLTVLQVSSKLPIEELIKLAVDTGNFSYLESDPDSIDREVRALVLEMYQVQKRLDVELN